jgi:DeoR/GlpR family transcriptional regulator of sugar metabolism
VSPRQYKPSPSLAEVAVARESGPVSPLRYESAPVRRVFIMERVRDTGFCSAVELSRDLGVSEMTVRRDIQRLAREGLARVVHGGISSTTTLHGPVDFRLRAAQRLKAKQAIARKAVGLLAPSSVVALDAGTTTLEVARLMPADLQITVVTHSLPVISILGSRMNFELLCLGGALHSETQAFAGPITLQALSNIRVHTLLLGATSVRDNAMWCTNTFDAATKRALIEAADRVILLADSAKFDITAMMKVADLSEIDVVVTDADVTAEAKAMLKDIELVIVERENA